MNRKKNGLPLAFILIFVGAIALAFLLSAVLPIPAKFSRLIFFVTIPVVSFVGILVAGLIDKKRR